MANSNEYLEGITSKKEELTKLKGLLDTESSLQTPEFYNFTDNESALEKLSQLEAYNKFLRVNNVRSVEEYLEITAETQYLNLNDSVKTYNSVVEELKQGLDSYVSLLTGVYPNVVEDVKFDYNNSKESKLESEEGLGNVSGEDLEGFNTEEDFGGEDYNYGYELCDCDKCILELLISERREQLLNDVNEEGCCECECVCECGCGDGFGGNTQEESTPKISEETINKIFGNTNSAEVEDETKTKHEDKTNEGKNDKFRVRLEDVTDLLNQLGYGTLGSKGRQSEDSNKESKKQTEQDIIDTILEGFLGKEDKEAISSTLPFIRVFPFK